MRVVATIPARLGSKRVARKNLRLMNDEHPMIWYAIRAALDAQSIDAVYVNSESDEIGQIGLEMGAEFYKRSPELAGDATTSDEFIVTASVGFVPIPDMEIDVVVPPGTSWQALITFSGESRCSQDPPDVGTCWVQAVIDPGAAVICIAPLPTGCASPATVIFDSIQHSANSTDVQGWGTHSFQWTHELTPGSHTIEMQWATNGAGELFSLDAGTLSVQLYPV